MNPRLGPDLCPWCFFAANGSDVPHHGPCEDYATPWKTTRNQASRAALKATRARWQRAQDKALAALRAMYKHGAPRGEAIEVAATTSGLSTRTVRRIINQRFRAYKEAETA